MINELEHNRIIESFLERSRELEYSWTQWSSCDVPTTLTAIP